MRPAVGGKQIEDPGRAEFDPGLGGIPVVTPDSLLECRDLEILFYIHRQRIAHQGVQRARRPTHQPS